MKHAINIQVNGMAFTAEATISHTHTGRVLESVTCGHIDGDILSVIERTAVNLDDVLYIAAEYLTLTGKTTLGTSCGPLAIDVAVIDPERFIEDVNGKTYMVKLIDVHSNLHLFDVGACNGLTAMHYAAQSLTVPVRSSVTQPILEA